MPKSNHLPNSEKNKKFRKSTLSPNLEKHLRKVVTPDIEDSDFDIHLKAREYLMLMQALLASYPHVEYRDMWQVLVFMHNLVTESESKYLGYGAED